MRIDWRAICGPALATAAALVAAAADRTLLAVPGLAPLFVCIAAVAASLSGLASGMVSAAIAVPASSLLFLPPPRGGGPHNSPHPAPAGAGPAAPPPPPPPPPSRA